MVNPLALMVPEYDATTPTSKEAIEAQDKVRAALKGLPRDAAISILKIELDTYGQAVWYPPPHEKPAA